MRRTTALTLVAALTIAGCGEDDAEPPPDPGESEEARPTRDPTVDRTLGDTVPVEAGPAVDAPAAAPERASAGATGAAETASGSQEGGDAGSSGATGRMYTVQIASFTDAATARDWAARLRGEDLPVWVSEVRIGERTYHRVRVGAAPTIESARRVGALLHSRYDWPVWIAPLTAEDRIPANAVRDTRRIIEGG